MKRRLIYDRIPGFRHNTMLYYLLYSFSDWFVCGRGLHSFAWSNAPALRTRHFAWITISGPWRASMIKICNGSSPQKPPGLFFVPGWSGFVAFNNYLFYLECRVYCSLDLGFNAFSAFFAGYICFGSIMVLNPGRNGPIWEWRSI